MTAEKPHRHGELPAPDAGRIIEEGTPLKRDRGRPERTR